MTWTPVAPDDTAALTAVGDRLRVIGFVADMRSASSVDPMSWRPIEVDTLTDVALELLRAGIDQPRPRVIDALGVDGFEVLCAIGLLEVSDDIVRAAGRVVAWKERLLVGDRTTADDPELVVPVSGTTGMLDSLAVCRRVPSAVDIGTGAGALAVRLAQQSDRVVATDVNRRAVSLAKINAAMNGCAANVSVREGSLLDPVGDDEVDLILGNLPFVLSPDQHYLFRDGDRPSGQLIREAVTAAASRLVPGGVAQFMASWPITSDDPTAAPFHLVGDVDCDVIALQFTAREPFEHCSHWNREMAERDRERFDEAVRRWVSWFVDAGVLAIASGALILRRPIGRPGVRVFFEASHGPVHEGGRQVERMLRAMEEPDAPTRPDAVPTLPPHRLLQALTHDGTSYQTVPAEVAATDSAGVSASVPAEAVPMLLAMDGGSTVADLVARDPALASVLDDLWCSGLLDLDLVADGT